MKEVNSDIVTVIHKGIEYKCTLREVAVGKVVANQVLNETNVINDIRKIKRKINYIYAVCTLIGAGAVKYLFFV